MEEPTGMAEGDDWLEGVAKGASRDAGDAPVEFLGDYLSMLDDAATYGHPPARGDLEAVRLLGRRAAEAGVTARQGVSLYLSAARRVWDDLPALVRKRSNAAVRAAATALILPASEFGLCRSRSEGGLPKGDAVAS
jgi:hypothetical protein